MSNITSIVPRTRIRKLATNGGFEAAKLSASLEELVRDVQELQNIYTNSIQPLITELPLGVNDEDNGEDTPIGNSLDAIRNGLSGDQLWTDNTALFSSSNLFWDGGRKLTIKETTLKLASRIDSLMATLSQLIEESQDFISAYTKAYIGEKAFDPTGTSAGSSIDGQLVFIQTFVGMDNHSDSTPTYTTNNYVTDGESLEDAISALDTALATLYTTDGEGIELAGMEFSLELNGGTLSKTSFGLKAENTTAQWNADEIQGNPVDSGSPSLNDQFYWDGVEWTFAQPINMVETFNVSDLRPLTSPGPAAATLTSGIAPDNTVLKAYNFSSTVDEYIMFVAAPPKWNGDFPDEVKLTAVFIPDALSGNSGNIIVRLSASNEAGTPAILGNGSSFGITWSTGEKIAKAVAADAVLYCIEFAPISLSNTNAPPGYIAFRLGRLGTDVLDTLDTIAVNLVEVSVKWSW